MKSEPLRVHLLSIRWPAIAALALVAAGAPGIAQELRLTDGRVLVGRYAAKGDTYEVETRDGTVVVPKGSVSVRTERDELLKKLRERAKEADDSAFAHLHLAMQARDYGLDLELWRHLDAALVRLGERAATDTERQPVERRVRDFLAQLEPELLPRKYRRAPTATRVEQLLRLLRTNTGGGQRAAIEELLVREPNADQDLRNEARRNGNPRQRVGALAALARRQLAGNDRFVLRTAILDRDDDVRGAAIAIGRQLVDAEDITYLASGLVHANPKVRVRTAAALGGLGDASAVDLLVRAGPYAGAGLAAAGGGDDGVRGNVAFLQQQAYIRDYDVEVAQAAFIADPKVDVLQSGTVLDVEVGGIYEVRTIVTAYRGALRQLTGSDPGPDPWSWSRWRDDLPTRPIGAPPPTTPGKAARDERR